MNGFSKTQLVAAGAVIALAGALALAVPVFTTQDTKEVVKIGDLKVSATEDTSHTIPRFAALAALLLGMVVIGTGLTVKR
jgi:hypothetical protein